MGGYSKSTAVFWEDTSTQTDCQNECSNHSFCMGFHFNTANSLCQLSTMKEKGLSGCSTCDFYQRACYVTTVGKSNVTGVPVLNKSSEPCHRKRLNRQSFG